MCALNLHRNSHIIFHTAGIGTPWEGIQFEGIERKNIWINKKIINKTLGNTKWGDPIVPGRGGGALVAGE